ncbi:MAG: type III-A CRISPR-associated RAMP protein Csm3, partial [Gammaproteobacteria bacterium]|nr:type III-A CRISPR-associated RAMP protein Csm3 [Gammaproteobacteria bacterium]
MTHSLLSTHRISATLILRSGLHIGAGKDAIEIGGLDLPVVKQPFTQEPYIPGSSLKGKLRSLLEWALNQVEDDGSVWGSNKSSQYDANDPILRAFGTTHKQWSGGPTRLLVRDAYLEKAWADSIREQGLPFTEEKMEVTIDRIQGKAKDGGLRRTERVPAGARFELDMVFKVFAWNGDGGEIDRDC